MHIIDEVAEAIYQIHRDHAYDHEELDLPHYHQLDTQERARWTRMAAAALTVAYGPKAVTPLNKAIVAQSVADEIRISVYSDGDTFERNVLDSMLDDITKEMAR